MRQVSAGMLSLSMRDGIRLFYRVVEIDQFLSLRRMLLDIFFVFFAARFSINVMAGFFFTSFSLF